MDTTKQEVKRYIHIHGCGHPIRPVVLCDDVVCTCIGLIEYMQWSEYHDAQQKDGKCEAQCYFCWMNKHGYTAADLANHKEVKP